MVSVLILAKYELVWFTENDFFAAEILSHILLAALNPVVMLYVPSLYFLRYVLYSILHYLVYSMYIVP